MKKLLVLLFSILISINSYGEWTFITTNDRGDNYFVDLDTIKKQEGDVYYWELLDFAIPLMDITYSSKSYIVTDCNLNLFRYKYLRDIFYSQPMLKGSIVHSSDIPDTEWRFNSPESTGVAELKRVCDFTN